MFEFFSSPLLLDALVRTLWLGTCVALLSGVLAAVMAWLVVRTDIAGGRWFERWLSTPYSLPAYLLALAWMVLGNPSVGLLKDFLPEGGITSLWGIVFVETSVAFVFPFLELCAGFRRLDPALEEAARLSGAGVISVIRRVSLPLLLPALLSGMGLSFLYAISSFGVPALLGMPARKLVLTTLIYSQFRLGGPEGLQKGLWISLLLLAFSALVLGLLNFHQRRTLKRLGKTAIATGRVARESQVRLGRFRYAASLIPGAWVALTLVLPWFALGLSALAQGPGQYQASGWSLTHLQSLLDHPLLLESAMNSVALAVGISLLVTASSFFMAFKEVRRSCKIARGISEVLLLPFGTPGSALALLWLVAMAFVLPGTSVPLVALFVTCALKYFAVGIRAYRTAYRQVDPVLEEAARLSGAGTGALLTRIWSPLLKSTTASVLFLVAMPVLTELTMSLLLTGPGASTLGTLLFQLQEYANPSAAAALAWVLLSLAILISLVLSARSRTLDRETS